MLLTLLLLLAQLVSSCNQKSAENDASSIIVFDGFDEKLF